jgi:hypothetical protein
MVHERGRICFAKSSQALVDSQHSMPHIASIGFRERTSGLLAIPLYLFHKACRVDQLPLGLRQHWHIHLAAPAVHGLWHLSSGPVQTKSRARIVDEMARGVEWQEFAASLVTNPKRSCNFSQEKPGI